MIVNQILIFKGYKPTYIGFSILIISIIFELPIFISGMKRYQLFNKSKVNKTSNSNYFVVGQIFNQYYPALCFFANKILNDRPVAEDIVEEVFIKLWKKEPDFNKHKNIKAALYIAVKNASLNYIKAQSRDRLNKAGLQFHLQGASEDCILNEITRAEVLREVYAELQQLPAQCRKVMELYFREGLNHKDIADQLGITVSTVKNQKARGIQILKKKLGPSFLLFWLL